MNTKHVLMTLAEQADARYSETAKSRTGAYRWTMTKAQRSIPEVQDAYRAKVNADEAWLTFMRTSR